MPKPLTHCANPNCDDLADHDSHFCESCRGSVRYLEHEEIPSLRHYCDLCRDRTRAAYDVAYAVDGKVVSAWLCYPHLQQLKEEAQAT